MKKSEIITIIRDLLNEDSATDIFFNKEGKRIYNLIVKKIDSIPFESTNENDFLMDTKGRKHLLEGVKFNLSIIDKKYDVNVLLVNTIGTYRTPSFSKKNNAFVFFIISQGRKDDFDNNSYFARLRFKSWVDESTFVHEFVHYLDSKRYKNTYKFLNPKNDAYEYYNSPEEYNSFYAELVNKILKNKKRLLNLNADEFVKQAIKYGNQTFIKSLNKSNLNKLKKRIYKLYNHLKTKL